jgi:hypothetical protein
MPFGFLAEIHWLTWVCVHRTFPSEPVPAKAVGPPFFGDPAADVLGSCGAGVHDLNAGRHYRIGKFPKRY